MFRSVPNSRRVVVAKRSRSTVVAVALLALGAAGCASKASAGPAASTTAAHSHDMASMPGMSHDMASMPGMGTVIAATATGQSPCEKAQPKPASPGQVGNGSGGSSSNTDAEGGHGHRGMVQQLPLTDAERKLLIVQMRQARSVIDRYPTVQSAEAAGYRMSTVYVPCIGAHYTNMRYVASFDPANPSELLFDGTTPDAKIVGLSYLVWHPGGPPAGFAGPNDHFHQHNANGGLCLAGGTVVGGENVSAAQCAARGGTKSAGLMKDVWMEHAWVAPGWECSWGVFAGECPELGGKLGGSAFSK
mgnify:FL=1